MLRLYTRVLELLGKEARLGWILAGANLLLAGAQFAEPVLFGKIVDVLSGKPQAGPLASNSAWPLLAAWVAFGLFTIACSATSALHAMVNSPNATQASRNGHAEFEPATDLPESTSTMRPNSTGSANCEAASRRLANASSQPSRASLPSSSRTRV